MKFSNISTRKLGPNDVGMSGEFSNDIRIKIYTSCDGWEIVDHGRDWGFVGNLEGVQYSSHRVINLNIEAYLCVESNNIFRSH